MPHTSVNQVGKSTLSSVVQPNYIYTSASSQTASLVTQQTMLALQVSKFSSTSEDIPSKPSLNVVSLPIPSPAPGSLLLKIHASLINPSDAANATGYFPYTTFPRVVGRDFAGTVVSGPAHLLGQRVFGTSGREFSFTQDGAHAEYCVLPEEDVVVIPENLSFIQAATIGVPFTTAWIAVERARVTAEDTVLVIGAYGAVGTAVCQIARARGARVITAARRDTADVNLLADPSMEGVKALTVGEGPSVVVDTVGDVDMMRHGLDILAKRGRLSYISAPKNFDAQFSFNMKAVYRAEKEIIGCNSLNYTMKEMADVLRKLAPGFSKGEYRTLEGKIAKVKLGQEALDAYRAIRAGKSGKFMICP